MADLNFLTSIDNLFMLVGKQLKTLIPEWSLWQADRSSRGVLPTVVHGCVWSRYLMNEEARDHWGLLSQNKKLYRIKLEAVTVSCKSLS
jgi:hypothetical protein